MVMEVAGTTITLVAAKVVVVITMDVTVIILVIVIFVDGVIHMVVVAKLKCNRET